MAVTQKGKRRSDIGEDVNAKSAKKVKIEAQPSKTRTTRSKPVEPVAVETEPEADGKKPSKSSTKKSTTAAEAVELTTTQSEPESATLKGKSKAIGSVSSKSAAAVKKTAPKQVAEPVKEAEITLDQVSADEEEESDEEDAADHAAALLAGFESDSESDAEQEDGVPADKIPSVALKGKDKTALAAAKKKGATDEPGTIYIGRIPHGFYEPQMRSYFSQFGTITKLRLSRNKRTGRSKHYAFIEFDSSHVADIVARTMNKYLLFGHILQVRVMAADQIPDKLWVGANRRYKVVPRGDLEGRKMKEAKTVEAWSRKEARENKRRASLRHKMQGLGYDFDVPLLKGAENIV